MTPLVRKCVPIVAVLGVCVTSGRTAFAPDKESGAVFDWKHKDGLLSLANYVR